MTKTKTLFAKIYVVLAVMAGVSMAFFTLVMFVVNDPRDPWFWPYLFFISTIAIFYSAHAVHQFLKTKKQSVFYRFICDNFLPNPNYELNGWAIGKYIGIDTRHGTMLMVSSHDNVFKGKNIKELTGYECRGEMLTLKFNDIGFPTFRISVGTESACMAFGHKLDVLLSSSYQPAINTGRLFNDFVQQKSLAF